MRTPLCLLRSFMLILAAVLMIPNSAAADEVSIGALLPLTGKHSAVGGKSLDGIVAGLSFFDGTEQKTIRLYIEDDASEPARAGQAAERLIRDRRVLLILGPPDAAAALEAAKVAQSLQVPLLALCPLPLDKPLEFVFSDEESEETEARTLAAYAVKDLGLSRIAVLYPSNRYGKAMAGAFRDEVLRLGGKAPRVQSYRLDQTDFSADVRALAGLKAAPASKKKQLQRPARSAVDFDALFIPDSFARVRMILPQLAFHDIRGVQLLGSSLWYAPEGIRKDGDAFEGALMTAPFFADSGKRPIRDFSDSFFEATGRDPDYREALAFDTARMVRDILNDPRVRDAITLKDRLKSREGFEGTSGVTGFSKSGRMQHRSFILKVEGRQLVDVEQ